MSDRPREIWCDTGLYWDYVEDWSEGSWRNHDDWGGEKYVRADYVAELEAKLAKAMEAGVDVAASLSAAISLLEQGGKKAAPSDKMFNQMLVDYKASLARFRTTLAELNS